MINALSRLTNNGNQNTTQYSNKIEGIISETNDIDELPEGI